MSHSPEELPGHESRWLINEMRLLAEDAGLTTVQAESICRFTKILAEEVFSGKETCLPIDNAEDISLLRELCANGNPLISEGKSSLTPLVFDATTEPNRPTLYFKKYYDEENFIAQRIQSTATLPPSELSETQKRIIDSGPENGFEFALADEQRNAVCAILTRRFSIISGGPGTGKTTLLLRALIGLLTENPESVIEIAAPTGKAAARIRESITKQISKINTTKSGELARESVRASILKIVPKTLHSLLSVSFRTSKPKAVSADVVIIDEASMISQSMMAVLLSALTPNTKLILLGDKNQLDSVQPGYVFGDFYVAPILAGSRVSLVKSHRFNAEKFIGKFASAVLKGSEVACAKILEDSSSGHTDIELCTESNTREQIERILKTTLPDELKNPPIDADPTALLRALEDSRVLTPTAEGPFGKNAINTLARKIFSNSTHGEHFHGRPILITQNATEFSLNNGDIGIILRSPENQMFYAWFLDENGKSRKIPIALLPEHETAYAMTIHKSQGSEFSRLSIFFPKNTRRGFYTRQLLYTAITRFKETPTSLFCFCYDAEAVASAVSTATQSHSLLPQKLKERSEYCTY